MYEPKSIIEQILFTTFRLEVLSKDNKFNVATGFVFGYTKDRKSDLFLVTNKHVINDSKKGKLYFTESDGNRPLLGQEFIVEIDEFEDSWIKHSDEFIDVAIMPFADILIEAEKKTDKLLYYRSISNNLIPSTDTLNNEIHALEEIIFVGYPKNLYDQVNLTPIFRRGITASPIFFDFNGEPIFLIDASVYPGSSGSPVFICNIGSYVSKSGSIKIGSNRILFLGLVSSTVQMYDNLIKKLEETSDEVMPEIVSKQFIDIGVVYKAKTIVDLIETL